MITELPRLIIILLNIASSGQAVTTNTQTVNANGYFWPVMNFGYSSSSGPKAPLQPPLI